MKNIRVIPSFAYPFVHFLKKTAKLVVQFNKTLYKVSDFTIGDYTFEVGGRRKGQRQISSVAPGFGFIVKDEIEYAYENQIPLWMFGFIY